MMKTTRETDLMQWLKIALPGRPLDMTAASEDASFRRYFRVQSGEKTWIAMDAPPDKEDCKPFVDVAAAFQHVGLNVPRVYEQDIERGFLLLTDLGSTCYLDCLNENNADSLYADAMLALLDLQANEKPNNLTLPPYDEVLLKREMQLFSDWFLEKHVQISLNDEQNTQLSSVHQTLVDNALVQHQTWVHRDFHSRNLMFTAENNPGVIDFQDAVVGPITYDLVSLLRDCYISWPNEKIENWVEKYLRDLQQRNLCVDVSLPTFMKWFDLMGVQRHLKAIGIFSRLNYRDGKPVYLGDIPRTLAYVQDVSAKYETLETLHQLITSTILPALEGKR